MSKYILTVFFLFITIGAQSQSTKEKQKSIENKKEDPTEHRSISKNNTEDKKLSDTSEKKRRQANINAVQKDEIVNIDDSMTINSTRSNVNEKSVATVIVQKEYFALQNLLLYLASLILGILFTYIITKKSFNTESGAFQREIKHLKKEIEWLKLDKNKTSKKNENTPIITHPEIEVVPSNQEIEELSKEWKNIENKIEPINDSKTLYFPNPNQDGNFKHNEGKETFLEGASVYKFTLQDEYNAMVEFCDNVSSVKIALNNKNIMILGLAIETNSHNPNVTQILIVDNKKAKAQLEGNIWVIKEKAKIKYV